MSLADPTVRHRKLIEWPLYSVPRTEDCANELIRQILQARSRREKRRARDRATLRIHSHFGREPKPDYRLQ